MNNLIRKHKISLITEIPLSGRDKEIIDYIENTLNKLKYEYTYENKIKIITFYDEKGAYIFRYHTNNIYGGEYLISVLKSKFDIKIDRALVDLFIHMIKRHING